MYSGNRDLKTPDHNLPPVLRKQKSNSSDNSEYSTDSDSHSSLELNPLGLNAIYRLQNAVFKSLKMNTDFSIPDSVIPDLPPNPYATASTTELSPNITVKQHNQHKLLKLYDDYALLKSSVIAAESACAPADRTDLISNNILSMRHRLKKLHGQRQPLIDALKSIVDVQETLRPALKVPTDHARQPHPLDLKDVKEFVGQSLRLQNEEKRLHEVWKKLVQYSELKELNHANFKLALTACLTGDQYAYIEAFPTATVKKLAELLAARFITENVLADAIHDLDTFTRLPNEPIRQAVARLQSCLEKAIIMYPADQQETIKEFQTDSTIKQIISPAAKRLVDKHQSDARLQGIKLSTSQIVRLAEEEEKRSGFPTENLNRPINLYNTTVSNSSDARFENIDTRLDKLTNMMSQIVTNLSDDSEYEPITDEAFAANLDAECHAATKTVRFTNKRSPYSRTTPSIQKAQPSQINFPPAIKAAAEKAKFRSHSPAPPSMSYKPPNYDPLYSQNSDQTMTDASQSSAYYRPSYGADDSVEKARRNARDSRNHYRSQERYASQERARARSKERYASTPQYQYRDKSRDRYPSQDRYRSQDRSRPQQRNSYQNDYRSQNNYRSQSRDYRYNRQNSQSRQNGRYPNSRSNSQSRDRNGSSYRYNQKPNSNSPTLNSHDNSQVHITQGVCKFCHSEFKHDYKDCFVVKAASEALQAEN